MTLKSEPFEKDLQTARLDAQFSFLNEAEKLKTVLRANQVMDRGRFENSAEHSWHACLFALICAPLAPQDVSIDRAIRMLVVHDLVEIDAGDHPIHIEHDPSSVQALELTAADRIFGLLPKDIRGPLRALWEEFEAKETATAQYAKSIDFISPALQCMGAVAPDKEEDEIIAANFARGRARQVIDWLPALFDFAKDLFEGNAVDPVMKARFAFWVEADKLKRVERATKVIGTDRFDNTAEHSWHVMLYALVLSDQAAPDVDLGLAVTMLLLHDLVEIDAGDAPLHGTVTPSAKMAQALAEEAAAERLFGLLPNREGLGLQAIWEEFEAAETSTAIFAKSIDRLPPLFQNLAHGGHSWVEYNVTFAQIEQRVGTPVSRGLPHVWPHCKGLIKDWFEAHPAHNP